MARDYELPPAYTKAFDLCVWLLGRTAKFPASYRVCLAPRLDALALDLVLTLRRAAESRDCAPHLRHADELLADLRVLLRIAYAVKAFRGVKSYRYASAASDEIVRMVRGWLKSLAKHKPRHQPPEATAKPASQG